MSHPFLRLLFPRKPRSGLPQLSIFSLLWLGCAPLATHGDGDRRPEPVESITIEETLPNRAGEFSVRFTADYRRTKDSTVAHLPSVELNLGLTDFLDVEVEVPLLYSKGEHPAFGLGDVSTTLKWLIAEERKRMPAFVLGVEMEFPTGSVRRELGEGACEVTPFLASLKKFGDVVLQGNIGWSRVLASRNGEREENLVFGASLAFPIHAQKLYAFAELTGSRGVNRSASAMTAAPGLKWRWNNESFVAVALTIPLKGAERGVGIVTQFQWEF